MRRKNGLIKAGLKGKTIRDNKMAPVRAVLQWAANVADRITVSAKAKPAERIRGYTDEEAKTILSAALQEKDS